jgi:hypothetical protein
MFDPSSRNLDIVINLKHMYCKNGSHVQCVWILESMHCKVGSKVKCVFKFEMIIAFGQVPGLVIRKNYHMQIIFNCMWHKQLLVTQDKLHMTNSCIQ